MRQSKNRPLAFAAAVAGIPVFMIQTAHASVAPVASPGAAVNLFSGDYSNGNNIVNSGGLPYGITDGDVDPNDGSNLANSASGSPSTEVYTETFGQTLPTSANVTSGTFATAITDIRIYAESNSGASPPSGIESAYNIPPTSVAFIYGYTSGNPQNAGGVTDDTHWGSASSSSLVGTNQGTILAINGVATGAAAGDSVELTDADWTANGVVPGTAGPGVAGVYYVDLTVNIPVTDAIRFDWGVSPNRTDGNGGIIINEIQGFDIPAPEPATLGLLSLSSLGLLARRRRR